MLGIDQALTDNLLDKISSTLECTVCSEIMHVPVIATCGHSFCYECCSSWFKTKVSCPVCRHDLETPPILNVQLKEISSNLVDLMLDHGDIGDEEKQHIKLRREENNEVYLEHQRKHILYGDAFSSILTVIDRSDGVPRCSNCHWEAHGTECLHCGAVFRVAPDDGYDSAEAYDEDEMERREFGDSDRYDSDDSFVDSRSSGEIFRERGPRHEIVILNDDGFDDDNESWRGFRSPTEISYSDTSDREFNQAMMTMNEDVELGGSDVSLGERRRPVIEISDDE